VKFDKWFSPVLYSLQGLVFLGDAGAGLIALYKHHWIVALINFCGAAFVGTTIYFTHKGRRRHEATMRQLRMHLEELERRRAMTVFDELEAQAKAKANLELVMKATGAKFREEGRDVIVPIGNYQFLVQNGYVYKFSSDGSQQISSTCIHFSDGSTPVPEFFASVILLLKHDPSIFDCWKRQDGYYA
jgi:hypothetical protein